MSHLVHPLSLRSFSGVALLLAMALVAGPSPVFGQGPQPTPMGIGTLTSTLDEYGNVLRGSYDTPITNCCLVMVLWATNGASDLRRANVDGTPHPKNAPVTDSSMLPNGRTAIGHALLGPASTPGTFSVSVTNTIRINKNRSIFVRIFNAPTLEAATFYRDSLQVLPIPQDDTADMIFTVPQTDWPLDPADPDGDGLNNSWEKNLGTDPYLADTDGDGNTDLEEWIAGSRGNDPTAYFIMTHVRPGPGNHTSIVGWPSMASKKYILQYIPDLSGAQEFVDVSDEITATGNYTEVTFTNAPGAARGYFRARAVTAPPELDPCPYD